MLKADLLHRLSRSARSHPHLEVGAALVLSFPKVVQRSVLEADDKGGARDRLLHTALTLAAIPIPVEACCGDYEAADIVSIKSQLALESGSSPPSRRTP